MKNKIVITRSLVKKFYCGVCKMRTFTEHEHCKIKDIKKDIICVG